MEIEKQFKVPTETIELPSKGIVYPEENALSLGTVEMKYMTAYHEDILTNQNYIQKGIVLDKLLEELIVSPIKIGDLITGDKNALLIGARIMGYGQKYSFKSVDTDGELIDKIIDLTKLKDKNLDPNDMIEERLNEFSYKLPHSGIVVTYKLLTHDDYKSIDKELEGLKKLFPKATPPEMTVRLKHMILSIDQNRDRAFVRSFVDKQLLARDAKELRNEVKRVSPDVDLNYKENDDEEGIFIPINLNFFWPESTI